MENQTVDQMINEYGFRLAELENLFFSQYGVYPFYDCVEFWEDPQVSKVEGLLDFWWGIKKEREGKPHAS